MLRILEFITSIYSYLAVFPFLTFLLLWMLLILILQDRMIATKLASDMTTILLIGANAALINLQFSTELGIWIMMTVLLISFGLLGSWQLRKRGRSNPVKITRMLWRTSFVIFSLSYLLFFVFRVGHSMFYVL